MGATISNPEATGTGDSSVRVLQQKNVLQNHTGDTTETTVDTWTLPGGTMGPNDWLEIHTLWTQLAGQSSAVNNVVQFGGNFVLNKAYTSLDTMQSKVLILNKNSQTAQKFMNAVREEVYISTSSIMSALTVDTTADVIINFRIKLADGAETGNLEGYSIRLVRGT